MFQSRRVEQASTHDVSLPNKQRDKKHTNTKDRDLLPEQERPLLPAQRGLQWGCTYARVHVAPLRWEGQLEGSHIASVGDPHILAIVPRHTSLHIHQIPPRVDLVHLRSTPRRTPTSKFWTVQFLFPMRPGIFFPLNVFPGSYR